MMDLRSLRFFLRLPVVSRPPTLELRVRRLLRREVVEARRFRLVEALLEALLVLLEFLLLEQVVRNPEAQQVHEEREDDHHEEQLDVLPLAPTLLNESSLSAIDENHSSHWMMKNSMSDVSTLDTMITATQLTICST